MKIVLSTLHAKYIHASLALPSLAAACSDLTGVDIVLREFTINESPDRVLRAIVAEKADLVAFSCYIWNITEILKLASNLKKVSPRTFIMLGGPEASFGGFEILEKNPAVDCIVKGEGEATFRECIAALASAGRSYVEALLNGIPGIIFRSGEEFIATPERPAISALDAIPSPFAAKLVDLAKPLIYYETSRGCPFSCAFCMSSLEKGVRSFGMERIKSDLSILMDSGTGTIKLVDRTFNYDAKRANEIWRFILDHNRTSCFHFEIAADLLTGENITLLREVPAGVFRFEIGVQSGEETTLERVGRKSDLPGLFANVERLVAETGVTIHLDLVAGLPHEDFHGFLDSLQRLLDVNPHHIQVEPLKVLKGSPMRKIARDEGYYFAEAPPYKILRNPWLSFDEIGRIETISRLLDLYVNSGRFGATLNTLTGRDRLAALFNDMAQFMEEQPATEHISQTRAFELIWEFARSSIEKQRLPVIRDALSFDFCNADYPSAGNSPSFFALDEAGKSGFAKPEIAAIARLLNAPAGSRIRTVTKLFCRDFRKPPQTDESVELLFIYISAPAKGLRIEVMEPGALNSNSSHA